MIDKCISNHLEAVDRYVDMISELDERCSLKIGLSVLRRMRTGCCRPTIWPRPSAKCVAYPREC